MASIKIGPFGVELRESEITKPQPLRIIKRSQTVANCSSPREIVSRGRSSSSGSYESKGSPPQGIDRFLTVRKKRQGRGSVIGLILQEPEEDVGSGSALSDIIRKHSDLSEIDDDPDVTPKARPSTRNASAGAFLKSEFHQRSYDIDEARFSVRDNRHSMFTPQQSSRRPPNPNKAKPSNIPDRRPSRSKNFFLRAIGGRSSNESKAIRRRDSGASKGTLIHRLSRSNNSSSAESYTETIASTGTGNSFQPSSLDIADVNTNSRLCSYEGDAPSSTDSDVLPPDVFVLCPYIVITPEVSSVDMGSCFLWVAIEVAGTLQKADGHDTQYDGSRWSSSSHVSELEAYGRLHSMRIDLHPGQGCVVTEIIGDLHKSKTIRAGETQLILAKIRFSRSNAPCDLRTSSDDLIAQLENDLGDSMTPYLTVRLTYKHSGFPNVKKPPVIQNGMSMHITRLQTEATGVIKRHNPLSAWSPRTSQTINSPLEVNPLINLVETYLPSEQAREAIRKLAAERTPIPLAKRFEHICSSSEETVKPVPSSLAARLGSALSSPLVQVASARGVISPPRSTGSPSPFARFGSTRSTKAESMEEMDPARRIWTEMRRHSRGGNRSRHPRGSLSADHYFSVDDNSNRISSINTTVSTISGGKGGGGLYEVKEERGRIMDMALKNKRSVGQETLKSIVPSVGRQKGGALSSLGLGVGRSWGWNPNWW